MKPVFKILVCGDRDWANYKRVFDLLRSQKIRLKEYEVVIIEGGAPGADSIAREAAKSLDMHVCEVKALWDTRHKGAGPQRNDIMLALAPDLVLGFHPKIRHSKGTRDMLNKTFKAGIETYLIGPVNNRRIVREITAA